MIKKLQTLSISSLLKICFHFKIDDTTQNYMRNKYLQYIIIINKIIYNLPVTYFTFINKKWNNFNPIN